MDLSASQKRAFQALVDKPSNSTRKSWVREVNQFAATTSRDLNLLDRKRGISLCKKNTESLAERFDLKYWSNAPRIFLPALLQAAQSNPNPSIKKEIVFYRYQQWDYNKLYDTGFPQPAFSRFERDFLPVSLRELWATYMPEDPPKTSHLPPQPPQAADPLPPSVASVCRTPRSLGVSRTGRIRRVNPRFSGQASRDLAHLLRGSS